MNLDVAMKGSETVDVVRISGHHDAASRLDGDRYDVSVGEIFRPGSGSLENAADIPCKFPVGVAYLDRALPAEARVDHLVVSGTSIQLGENGRGRDNRPVQSFSGFECLHDLGEAVAVLSRENR